MDATLIDASTLFFGTPYTQNNGQRIVPMSTVADRFEWNSRLNVQLGMDQDHMLVTEYGVNTPLPGSDPNRRNLDIMLTPELEASLSRFDNDIAKLCSERSQDFFGKPTLNKQHMPLVRRNQKDQPLVRVKVACGDKPTEVRVLGADNQTRVRPFTEINRNAMVLVVATTPGIWANATQFGISFTARGIIARPAPPSSGLSLFNLKPGISDAAAGDVGADGAVAMMDEDA